MRDYWRVRFAGAVSVIALLTACDAKLADEELIASRIRNMAAALEEKDTRRFTGSLAEDFHAVTYNLDRNGARLLLRREIMARDNLRVRLSGIEVSLRGESRAFADFRALLTGGSGVIPDEARGYRVNTGWRREDGGWEMISAEWEPVGADSGL